MSTLFKPSRIGNITLPNRFLRSATLEGMADENGGCTTQLIGLYEHLSEGGIGLIITGHAFVSEEGRATPFQIGLYKDSLIPGFRALTDAVHRKQGVLDPGQSLRQRAAAGQDPDLHGLQLGHGRKRRGPGSRRGAGRQPYCRGG